MTATEILLENLQSNGVTISVNGGNLKIHSPKRKLLPEVKEALKEHKAEIIQLISSAVEVEPDLLRDYCAVCESLLIEQPNGEWFCLTVGCTDSRLAWMRK